MRRLANATGATATYNEAEAAQLQQATGMQTPTPNTHVTPTLGGSSVALLCLLVHVRFSGWLQSAPL